MAITIIVAKSNNGIIGKDGDLPWRLPEDLKRFKRLTTGNIVVMGRKTYDSIGRPLPNRKNIVISRNTSLKIEGVEVESDLINVLKRNREENVYVIGGGQIYVDALPFTEKLEVTEVDVELVGDTSFPEIDSSQWKEIFREKRVDPESNLTYSFVSLERIA
ncbi:MAG: dihydrofolate reductase [Betaproteobacteria bacterium]